MFGPFRVHSNEGQIDVRLLQSGKLNLSLLRSLTQALHSHFVAAEIKPCITFKLFNQGLLHSLVKVVPAEPVVAGGGLNLEQPVT